MKVLWHSNSPWSPVGYGQQTALFTQLFQEAGHDVAISSFYGLHGSSLVWHGMNTYPSDDAWGNKMLMAYASHHAKGADVTDVQIITLMDVWVLSAPFFRDLRMASWVPVDHQPVPPAVSMFFMEHKAEPIAMSKFGQAALQEMNLDALYVPHGIKTDLFTPLDRAGVRKMLKVPEDAFIVGMVAANKGTAPSRKAYPEVLQAFKAFSEKHKDAFLYIHASANPGSEIGLNLLMLAKMLGIDEDRLLFTPDVELMMGIDEEKMPFVFNLFDVLVNPSLGEGFGIPIVEAQACGVPVITNDFSAMTELTGAGWSVSGTKVFDATQGAFWQIPNVGEIYEAMCDAYTGAEGLRTKAREFALQYDAKRVMDTYWTPVLAELERRWHQRGVLPKPKVGAPRNRQQRRSAASKR